MSLNICQTTTMTDVTENKCPFETDKKTRRTGFFTKKKMKVVFSINLLSPWHVNSLPQRFVCWALSLAKYYLHRLTPKSCPSPLQALSVAGLGAGLTEAVVVNPFEVVKVSLQANRDSFKEVDGNKIIIINLHHVGVVHLFFLMSSLMLVMSFSILPLRYSNHPHLLKQGASLRPMDSDGGAWIKG